MTSINGLRQISATSIQNSGEIYLGNNIDVGTAGQALVSGGPNQPARWDTHTGVINPLTMGTDLSLASGNATFDGSIPDTINAAGHGFGSGGAGIDISGSVITTDNDGTTINNTGGTGAQNQVLKVPNTLTITDSAGSSVVYDGSSTKSITINDNDTQLNLGEGNGIRIISAGLNRTISVRPDEDTIDFDGAELAVLKVPNALTAGTNISFSSGTTYDGSAAITISATDTDTTYQGGTGISINTATNPDTINCSSIPNTALQNSTISGKALGSNLSTLTFYDASGGFITSYNGADPPTSVNLPAAGSTYQGGSNISIDTTTTPDTINLDSAPTNLDLSSSTNVFPKFVGGGEILKSLSFIDNPSVQTYNRIYNTANDFIFSGGQEGGSDALEIDFVATSTSGYCEFGFYANSYNPGMIFMCGIAAATGGTSPFSTTLTSSPVSIDAFKLGLFDGSTNRYSLKEILDFTSYENTFLTSNFFFNNLSVGTRYRMALYGRCYNSGQIVINTGYQYTTGYANRAAHQAAFMKFYEYDSSIGGARTTGSGGGGGM